MAAGKFNDIIEKKADYTRQIQLFATYIAKDDVGNVPINLTAATITAKLRKKLTDPSPLISFTTSIVDAANGLLEISLTSAQTSSLNFDVAAWDLFVTFPSGKVEKFLEGNMVLQKAAS